MGSKKSAKATTAKAPAPADFKNAEREPHPTAWHSEVALRLRRLYYHRIKHAGEISVAPETVIGIPWETWAALSEERSTNLDHLYRSRALWPERRDSATPMSSELYTSQFQTGVDYKNKSYDDAIPVYARGDLPGGTIWFWFYPKG